MNDEGSTEGQTDESLQMLDTSVITAWRIILAGLGIVILAVLCGVLLVLHRSNTLSSLPVIAGVVALGVLVVVFAVWFLPVLEWRHWKYAVRDNEIEIRSGHVFVVQTLMPMARVQHVDMRQGPIERLFELTTIVIHTAAGGREIPGLRASTAAPIRARIAELANIHDDL